MADFYSVLGVSKSATEADIKRAYRKLALQWHPDRNKTAQAAEKFKEINKAYEVIGDPKKRETYDQYGEAAFSQGAGFGGGQGPFGGGAQTGRYGPFTYTYSTSGGANPFEGVDFGGFSDPFDIFEQFFGGASPFGGRAQTRRKIYRINIDFMEAVKGVEKTVEVEGKKQTIKIPGGVDDDTRVRFGDFDILISVSPHPTFKREGYDLVVDKEISFSQAALGDVVTVPTIDGDLSLKIQPGTDSGTLIRLRGKGVHQVRGGGRGDQYVRVKINIPNNLTSRQKELLREFENESKRKKGWF